MSIKELETKFIEDVTKCRVATYYISGKNGSGKTHFANWMVKKLSEEGKVGMIMNDLYYLTKTFKWIPVDGEPREEALLSWIIHRVTTTTAGLDFLIIDDFGNGLDTATVHDVSKWMFDYYDKPLIIITHCPSAIMHIEGELRDNRLFFMKEEFIEDYLPTSE